MADQPPLPEAQSGISFERDGVRVHTFTSPGAFLANSTHVIETADGLVVIDGQFVAPYAHGFRAYVDGLGKPIERLYLSHGHVDHFFGLASAFADVEAYAPAETIALLNERGEAMRAALAQQYGPFVPDQVVVPAHVVQDGTEHVGGLAYRYEIVHNTECDAALVIELPELKITVAQDLIYSKGHVYAVADSSEWIAVLQRFLDSDSTLFLAGHGPVADKAEVQRNIDYLLSARKAFETAAGPEEYKAAMIASFPGLEGTEILDISAPRLYGLASE